MRSLLNLSFRASLYNKSYHFSSVHFFSSKHNIGLDSCYFAHLSRPYCPVVCKLSVLVTAILCSCSAVWYLSGFDLRKTISHIQRQDIGIVNPTSSADARSSSSLFQSSVPVTANTSYYPWQFEERCEPHKL